MLGKHSGCFACMLSKTQEMKGFLFLVRSLEPTVRTDQVRLPIRNVLGIDATWDKEDFIKEE